MVKSRPHVILSAAISLDGKIATKSGDSRLSSKKDKIRVHKLRAKTDAILVGKNTVTQDNPLLTVRYSKGKNPIRIVLDSNATISSRCRIIQTCNKIPTIIAVSEKASKSNLARLERYPLDIIVSGQTKVDIKKLLHFLPKIGIKKILLEGGGTVNWDFINQGLIDEVIVTISPYLIGGDKATTLVQGKGFTNIGKSFRLKLQKINHQRNEVVLHYTRG